MMIDEFDRRRIAINIRFMHYSELNSPAKQIHLAESESSAARTTPSAERKFWHEGPGICRMHVYIDDPILNADGLNCRIPDIAIPAEDSFRFFQYAGRIFVARPEQQLPADDIGAGRCVNLIRKPVKPLVFFRDPQIEDFTVVDRDFTNNGTFRLEQSASQGCCLHAASRATRGIRRRIGRRRDWQQQQQCEQPMQAQVRGFSRPHQIGIFDNHVRHHPVSSACEMALPHANEPPILDRIARSSAPLDAPGRKIIRNAAGTAKKTGARGSDRV
ncbi:MAG: hypothetical protein ACE5FV_03695 [Woeseia sp.]